MTDNITRDILIRASFVHKMRKFREPVMFVFFASACAIITTTFFVSFGNVMHNFPSISELSSFTNFVMVAFLQTELFVKVAVVALSVALLRYTFFILMGLARFSRSIVGWKKVETALS